MKITKEEYLKALDIVEQYHLEFKFKKKAIEYNTSKYKPIKELQVGDSVEYVNLNLKYNTFTLNKVYTVVQIWGLNDKERIGGFAIRNDKNSRRSIREYTPHFKALNNI
jgi:hypothetical protein